MEEEEESKLGLSLGLGQCQFAPTHKLPREHNHRVRCHPSFPLYMKEEVEDEVCNLDYSSSRTTVDEDVEDQNNSSSVYCNTINSNNKIKKRVAKKKLVLTNGQLKLLEENFREHSVLTPIKKSELAEQLNLPPRKIEVWYQNRRARTKQMQKETNCEFWKTLCESLHNENRKLKIELQDLRSRKPGTSLHVHLPLTMTPSFDNHERRKEQSTPQWEEHLDLITPT